MMQPLQLVFGLFCVNVCTIINKVVIIIAIIINVSSLTLKTENISLHLHEDKEIVLNCTYDKESNEEIGNRNIRWQKQIGDTFKDLAGFSPPGGKKPFIEKKMEASYSNRTELIAPTNGSFSAVLIIKDILCDDAGLYRCWVEYFSDYANHKKNYISTVAFKATKPYHFRVSPCELIENQSLSISCNANVGSPKGNIKIWKFAKNSNVSALIFTFNASNIKTENCTEIINATIAYSVSRNDNDASFRCSSQNILNTGPGPSLQSQNISVRYGPDEPFILPSPNKSSFYAGDDVRLQCKTDSNPPSNFSWSFLSSNDSKEMGKSLLTDNATLLLNNIQLNDTGYYKCTVNNEIGTDHKVVSISVREPLRRNRTTVSCDQCGLSEICQKETGEAHCVTNVWMPIAIIFIIPCPIFVGIIIYLIKQRISLKNQQSPNKNPLQSQSVEDPSHPSTSREYSLAYSGHQFDFPNHPSEAETLSSEPASGSQTVCPIPYDHEAGYSTHQDLIGMQEQSAKPPQPDEHDDTTASQENLMLLNPDEHDDPTANQEKVQYAEVSKKQRTENVYDSPWKQLI